MYINVCLNGIVLALTKITCQYIKSASKGCQLHPYNDLNEFERKNPFFVQEIYNFSVRFWFSKIAWQSYQLQNKCNHWKEIQQKRMTRIERVVKKRKEEKKNAHDKSEKIKTRNVSMSVNWSMFMLSFITSSQQDNLRSIHRAIPSSLFLFHSLKHVFCVATFYFLCHIKAMFGSHWLNDSTSLYRM